MGFETWLFQNPSKSVNMVNTIFTTKAAICWVSRTAMRQTPAQVVLDSGVHTVEAGVATMFLQGLGICIASESRITAVQQQIPTIQKLIPTPRTSRIPMVLGTYRLYTCVYIYTCIYIYISFANDSTPISASAIFTSED